MDVESIVPQHGRMFKGKKMVNEFLDWIETLDCGIDLLTQENYRLP
jgi:flavorubredoxin